MERLERANPLRVDLRAFVEAIMRGCFDVAGVPPPVLGLDELETVSQHVYREAGLNYPQPSMRALAHRNGYQMIPRAPRGLCGEAISDNTIAYHWSPDSGETNGRVGHGLAHATLLRLGYQHGEADAWLLTGCLILPARVLAARGWLVACSEARAQGWLLDARRAQIELIERIDTTL